MNDYHAVSILFEWSCLKIFYNRCALHCKNFWIICANGVFFLYLRRLSDNNLRKRDVLPIFAQKIIGSCKTRKSLILTLVTTHGVKQNAHSGIVQSEVLLDDLFA